MSYPFSVATPLDSDNDPEEAARQMLFAGWANLREHAPRDPDELADLLVSCFASPQPDFYPSPARREKLTRVADDVWALVMKAADQLDREIPSSNDFFVLTNLLADRIPQEKLGELEPTLNAIEEALRSASKIALANRKQLAPEDRPAKVVNPFVRQFVRAVYWYIWHVEGEEPRVSFVGGNPTSRATILAEASLIALGYDAEKLEHTCREVRREEDWRADTFDFWDNFATVSAKETSRK